LLATQTLAGCRCRGSRPLPGEERCKSFGPIVRLSSSCRRSAQLHLELPKVRLNGPQRSREAVSLALNFDELAPERPSLRSERVDAGVLLGLAPAVGPRSLGVVCPLPRPAWTSGVGDLLFHTSLSAWENPNATNSALRRSAIPVG
jgi:hypothetical protein